MNRPTFHYSANHRNSLLNTVSLTDDHAQHIICSRCGSVRLVQREVRRVRAESGIDRSDTVLQATVTTYNTVIARLISELIDKNHRIV